MIDLRFSSSRGRIRAYNFTMLEARITSEVEPAKEIKEYSTEYGFEIRDPDEICEVARLLATDADFLNGEVSIGATDNQYVTSRPRLVVHDSGFYFKIDFHLHDYTWERMTSGNTKRARLNRLIREHVNPDYKFSSWKSRAIRNGKGELVAEFSDHSVFSYQFSDDELSQEELLSELREALILQQIVLSEAERESPSVTRFSSGVVVGNPYLYSHGWIRLPYNPLGSHMQVEDKFRNLTEEYLIRRMPDLEEARRVLSETVPKLSQAKLEIRRLKERIRQLRIGKWRRLRSGGGSDVLHEIREAANFAENCRILGIDPEIFQEMTDEKARLYTEGLRKTWARVYHSHGEFSERMKQINNAADFLGNYFSVYPKQ